ncbi:MAG: rhomboid family intramembrane serine protease [Roseiarcus sp.]
MAESADPLVNNSSKKLTTIGALKLSAARSPVTVSLVGVLTAIAGVQLGLFAHTVSHPDSNAINLITLFGIQGQRVWHNHEWWRLFTGPLIHGGLPHLAGNCLALFVTGILIEQVLGSRWVALLFALCGLGGAYASLLFNPPTMFSVGASGAIMGLLGATFVTAFRFPNGPMRSVLLLRSLQMIIPTLIPYRHAAANTVIDYAAHLGGLSVGVVVASAILLANREPEKGKPPLGWPAVCGTVAVLLFGLVLAVSALKPAATGDALADAAQAIDAKDYRKAFELLVQPAANGDAFAQTNLGWLYDNGLGVAQDYGKARAWFEMAAKQGNPSAEFNLGVMYAKGHGVDVDVSLAAKWYKMAADHGDADAQFSLGKLYETGDGVVWDLDQARKLYQSAAKGGNEDAQRALASEKMLKP